MFSFGFKYYQFLSQALAKALWTQEHWERWEHWELNMARIQGRIDSSEMTTLRTLVRLIADCWLFRVLMSFWLISKMNNKLQNTFTNNTKCILVSTCQRKIWCDAWDNDNSMSFVNSNLIYVLFFHFSSSEDDLDRIGDLARDTL